MLWKRIKGQSCVRNCELVNYCTSRGIRRVKMVRKVCCLVQRAVEPCKHCLQIVQAQSAVGREAVRMREEQSRALEGWWPCSRRARDVEMHLEMFTTPGNPEYTLSHRPLPLIPKRICASLAAVSVLYLCVHVPVYTHAQ
jgi:hypothetical protein